MKPLAKHLKRQSRATPLTLLFCYDPPAPLLTSFRALKSAESFLKKKFLNWLTSKPEYF